MKLHLSLAMALALVGAGLARAEAADVEKPAKELFGAKKQPADLRARSIGSYARGCLAGAHALPINGPAWQVMRLSRNRRWGHPMLVDFLERFAKSAKEEGWRGLLVGDMAQPRGGPMLTGHASHQIGLDADIWLTPMPERTLSSEEREKIGATSMLVPGEREVDPKLFTPTHATLIRRAALFPEVARIFVHPGIKKALCDGAGKDREWLSKVRPWWGHHAHFHVRLNCPPEQPGCKPQTPPAKKDGCGKELAYWLSDALWTPKPGPTKPKKPLGLADLPNECRAVLSAQ